MGNKVPKLAQEKFSQIELEELEKHFKILADQDGGGGEFITENTFKKYFLKDDPEFASRLYKAFDFDNDKKVRSSDFLLGMVTVIKLPEDEKLKFIFRMFETNGKASIATLKEFLPDSSDEAPIQYVEALWDFDKRHQKEIDAKKGDVMTLMNRFDETWWLVQNSNGEVGYIAANYVKLIDSPPPKPTGLNVFQTETIGLSEFLQWAPTSEAVKTLLAKFRKIEYRAPPAFELSGPLNFRHTTHIGYNSSSGGFEYNNMPPEWQAIMKAAGISPEEAAKPETAEIITAVLAEGRRQQVKQKRAGAPPAERPPPLPPKSISQDEVPAQTHHETTTEPHVAPPPAENPPPLPEKATAPKEPPPPLPPKADEPTHVTPATPAAPAPPAAPAAPAPPSAKPHGAPNKVPPPPPARPVADSAPTETHQPVAAGGAVGDLLADIRKGRKLRKVDPKEVNLEGANQTEVNDLAGILKKAMEMRRVDLIEKKEDENDDWD